jgi:hypothetical protein
LAQTITLDDALEAVDQLPLEHQEELIAIVRRRLAEKERQRILRSIEETRKDFAEGRCPPATPEEILKEILS